MSDIKECCVCYEATEHLTPCNHLICESCFQRLNICPMCRAPLGRVVEDIDEANQRMLVAAHNGHIEIARLMLSHGANNFNMTLEIAASQGHINVVELMLSHGATDFNSAMTSAAFCGHESIVRLMLERGAN